MADNAKASPNQSTAVIRKRKERFSDKEVQELICEIMANAEDLYGAKEIGLIQKAIIWEGIVRKVNKVGGMNRALIDCKKRWSDYKRKIRRILGKVAAISQSQPVNMEHILTSTQLRVALFFRLNEDINTRDVQELENNSPGDESKSGDRRDYSLFINISSSEDSEDEYSPACKKKSTASMYPSVQNDAQDQSVSQSLQQSSVERKTNKITPNPTFSHLQFENVEGVLKHFTDIQKDANEKLLHMQTSVSETLERQKKMYQLLKNNFKEMQKTLSHNEKMSNHHENLVDARLKSLQSHLDAIKETVFDKYQKSMTSNNSDDDDSSSVQSDASTTAFKSHKRKRETSRATPQK